MFTTEAVAMMLGRIAGDAEWLVRIAGLGELIFVRWALVVVSFERELYRDPTQDLSGRWWELVSRLQEVRPPEGRRGPDYASKIHLGTAPVYYQNYLLGGLAACQILFAFPTRAGGGLVGDLGVGELLRE